MEGFLDALGAVSLTVLVVIGALAGWIAGKLTGRNVIGYMILGIVGALLLPFLLAAVGIGVLAVGGILLLLLVAVVGAVIVIAVGRMIFDGRRG